jgi:putative phage-type endonuclease
MAINKSGISYEEWINERKKGLGGSDASVVLGLNRWKSRMALFLEKTGQIEPPKASERAYWGTVLEDIVAREFARRAKKKVRKRNFIFQDDEYPFLIANIDREIVGENAGLECKTTAEYNADDWKDDLVPDIYFCQCQHYCRVMGWDGIYIAVLIGLKDFKWKYIPRNDDFISMMVDREVDFWVNHVEKNIPPEWDGSDVSVQLPDDINSVISDYLKLDGQIKELEQLRDSYRQQLQALLGDVERGETSQYLVVWSNVVTNRLDTKAFKASHPDLYEQFSKPSAYRRFSVKRIEREE